MTRGLERRYGFGHYHFVTFSCYRRMPFFAETSACHVFETSLEKMRRRYGFCVDAYVVMPEHIHLLISEPKEVSLSVALQVLKISVSRRSIQRPFWQRRFYDFNVYTDGKRMKERRYIHRNPVTRGLVSDAKEWAWSSYRQWDDGFEGVVEVETPWTFARRLRTAKDSL